MKFENLINLARRAETEEDFKLLYNEIKRNGLDEKIEKRFIFFKSNHFQMYSFLYTFDELKRTLATIYNCREYEILSGWIESPFSGNDKGLPSFFQIPILKPESWNFDFSEVLLVVDIQQNGKVLSKEHLIQMGLLLL